MASMSVRNEERGELSVVQGFEISSNSSRTEPLYEEKGATQSVPNPEGCKSCDDDHQRASDEIEHLDKVGPSPAHNVGAADDERKPAGVNDQGDPVPNRKAPEVIAARHDSATTLKNRRATDGEPASTNGDFHVPLWEQEPTTQRRCYSSGAVHPAYHGLLRQEMAEEEVRRRRKQVLLRHGLHAGPSNWDMLPVEQRRAILRRETWPEATRIHCDCTVQHLTASSFPVDNALELRLGRAQNAQVQRQRSRLRRAYTTMSEWAHKILPYHVPLGDAEVVRLNKVQGRQELEGAGKR